MVTEPPPPPVATPLPARRVSAPPVAAEVPVPSPARNVAAPPVPEPEASAPLITTAPPGEFAAPIPAEIVSELPVPVVVDGAVIVIGLVADVVPARPVIDNAEFVTVPSVTAFARVDAVPADGAAHDGTPEPLDVRT